MQRLFDIERALSLQSTLGTRIAASSLRAAGFSLDEALFLLAGRQS